MKVPLKWLSQYVDLPADNNKLMSQLTALGHMQDGPPDEVADDLVYDLEIRQNRSDCLSLLGIAREVATANRTTVQLPPLLTSWPENPGAIQIEIENDQLAYRFNCLTIGNIKMSESPDWLVQALTAYGMPSINIVVDITNYVMIELGQPLHAFDATKISGNTLYVRSAYQNEKFTALGNKSVSLESDDLVIADSKQVLALAGVIGGQASEVTAQTTSIILEAATYNQASVRRSAMRHNLRTEASTRLEKFVHPKLTQVALQRAAHLLQELTGAQIIGHTDAYPHPKPDLQVTLTLDYLNKISGVEFTLQQASELLSRQEFDLLEQQTDQLVVAIPYWRTDLEQEADLVEEVIRVFGYENLPLRLPTQAPPLSIQSKIYDLQEKIKDILVACGFDEMISEPLTNEAEPELKPVRLENSLTSEKIMLRTTMQNSLAKALTQRRKYRQQQVALFEVGKIYFQHNGQNLEQNTLGLIASGQGWNYRKLKGVLELLLVQLNKPLANSYDIRVLESGSTFFAQLNIEELVNVQATTKRVITSPAQLILEDMSFLVTPETPVGAMLQAIPEIDPRIYKVELGEDPTMINDQKSVFIKLAYHDPKQNLTSSDIAPIKEQIIAKLQAEFGASLR